MVDNGMTNEDLLSTLKGTVIVEKAANLMEANTKFMGDSYKMREDLESYNDDWWKPKDMIQKDDITLGQEQELNRVTRNIWGGVLEIAESCKDSGINSACSLLKGLKEIGISEDKLQNYSLPLSEEEQSKILSVSGNFLEAIVGEKSSIPHVNKYEAEDFYCAAFKQINAIEDKKEKALSLHVLSEASLLQSGSAKKEALALAKTYQEKEETYNRHVVAEAIKFAKDINADGSFPVSIADLTCSAKQIADVYKNAKALPECVGKNVEEELTPTDAVDQARFKNQESNLLYSSPLSGLGMIDEKLTSNSFFLGGVKDLINNVSNVYEKYGEPMHKCGEQVKKAVRTSTSLLAICEKAKKEKASTEASRMLPPYNFAGNSR